MTAPSEKQFARVRIIRGTSISQDHQFGMRWPRCLAPSNYKDENYADDPDMPFEGVWNGRYWDLRAHGFGKFGERDSYGNGSIYVGPYEGVEIISNDVPEYRPAIVTHKLKHVGDLPWIPTEVLRLANEVKHQNYKVNTPTKFQKRELIADVGKPLMYQLGLLIKYRPDELDYVYFSCANGAEEHVDQLDPAKFRDTTFVIPVILPNGDNFITAEDEKMKVEIGGVYQFNHEKPHSMTVADNTGAVVIMVGVKK
ncbi:hypothetical protein [Ralstonia phage RP13]|nr:hypothetical protein [Ralstonia phage RP13]